MVSLEMNTSGDKCDPILQNAPDERNGENDAPVKVTTVPPAVGPESGEMPFTNGV
jgi:hypothetical protein